MNAEYELTLNDYLEVINRRKKHIIIVFLIVILIAIATATVMPPVYESVGTILVESQQIPTEMVKSTDTQLADERIEIIKQRVMTRGNLLNIINKYTLFNKDSGKLQPSELIEEMRNHIFINLLSANQSRGQEKAAIAFKVSFEYSDASIAYKVANDIVTLFLDENVKSRTERAAETTEFLDQESERLRHELEEVEKKVASYKQQYSNALPEHLELHMGMIQRTETELKDVEREYKSSQEELRYLQIELEAAKAGIGNKKNNETQSVITPESELDRLKNDLVKASATYKENHPAIKSLKRKIEALEKTMNDGSTSKNLITHANITSDPEALLRVEKVQAQIESAKSRIQSLAQQQTSLRSRISQIEGEVTLSPQVERGLSTLVRDYEIAKTKYEEIKSKQGNAKISENLEQRNKAERFALLEPPLMPDKPKSPNRKKILAIGFFLALSGAFALVMLMETLDKRVRGIEYLTSVIGFRPIGVVPYIKTQAEMHGDRNLYKYVIATLIFLVIIILVLIHFIWIPLDMLYFKVLARFE